MITYSLEPISPTEASRLKAWLTTAEAQLFRDCVAAQMHRYFFDSINIKCRPSDTALDRSKLESQARIEESKGEDVQFFLEMFELLAQPSHGFYKLKVNT
jgi:hypothetical protein